MWYLAGRCWAFSSGADGILDCEQLVRHLAHAQGARLEGKAFTGRTHAILSTAPGETLRTALPARFCWLGARLCAIPEGEYKGDHLPKSQAAVLEVWVSPLSKLWVKPTTRGATAGEDHRAALTHGSMSSFVLANRVRVAPHLFEFRIDYPQRSVPSDAAARACYSLCSLFKMARKSIQLIGGLDFVRDFVDLGTDSILQVLAGNARGYGMLRAKFDDMHRVMFGPTRLFHGLTAEERETSFESITTLTAPCLTSVAIARALGRNQRNFARKADSILLSRMSEDPADGLPRPRRRQARAGDDRTTT